MSRAEALSNTAIIDRYTVQARSETTPGRAA